MGAFDDLVPSSAPDQSDTPVSPAPSATPAVAASSSAPSSAGAFDDLVPGSDHPLTVTPSSPTPQDAPVPQLADGFATRSQREQDPTPDQSRAAQQEVYAGEASRDRSGNYLDTIGRGLARAVPFMDDIAAAGDTAASYVGLNTAPVGQANQSGLSFGQRYQDNLDRERAANSADDTDRTALSVGSQIAGGLALPVGAAGRVTGFVPKIVTGAGVGAGYGAAYGFGQGDGLSDRLDKAKTGAELGAAGGAIAPVVLGAAGQVAGGIGKIGSIAGRVISPENAAENQVVSTLARDMQNKSTSLSPTDWEAAQASGAPVIVGDAGGEATRALARSAKNSAPEAADALQNATMSRYGSQSSRIGDNINGLFDGGLNNTTTRQALQDQAAFVNRNNYNTAYNSPNAQSMWGEDFQRLAQAPAVQDAMRAATKTAGNRSVMAGEQKVISPFMTDEAGNLVPRTNPDGSTVTPSLRYWDLVQRELRDASETASRSGANGQASTIEQLRSQLLGAMEDPKTGVPQFNAARTGAFKAFNAEDALSAGQSFAGATKAEAITDQQAAFTKMSPPEKELFARGFASEIAQKAANAGDSRNVPAMFDNQAFRDKAAMALGSQRANQLEATLRTERAMTYIKNAVNGNSTTAKQLLEMGIASGATGALEAWHDGRVGIGTVAAAVMGGFLHHGYTGVNEKMAAHVGELLASNNPELVHKAVQQIATRPAWMTALRGVESKLPTVISQRTAPGPDVPVAASQPDGT